MKDSGIEYAIVCPNGFFNDMSEFLKMAKKGTVTLIGDGRRKINPIHGADLAKVCVDAVAGRETEIPVSGPVTYTYREIAELAFAVLGEADQDSAGAGVVGEGGFAPRPNVQQTVLHDSVRHHDHHPARLGGTQVRHAHAQGVLRGNRPEVVSPPIRAFGRYRLLVGRRG